LEIMTRSSVGHKAQGTPGWGELNSGGANHLTANLAILPCMLHALVGFLVVLRPRHDNWVTTRMSSFLTLTGRLATYSRPRSTFSDLPARANGLSLRRKMHVESLGSRNLLCFCSNQNSGQATHPWFPFAPRTWETGVPETGMWWERLTKGWLS
jgi:hypothetical protein